MSIKNIFINYLSGVHNLSAGHTKHEFSSGCAKEEIFKFFFDESKLKYL